MQNIHAQRLLILDFGSQYTQLIARRIREAGVYCEIYPFDVDDSAIVKFQPRGIILSGGPESVTEGETPRIPEAVFSQSVPILGICYGMQAIAEQIPRICRAMGLFLKIGPVSVSFTESMLRRLRISGCRGKAQNHFHPARTAPGWSRRGR